MRSVTLFFLLVLFWRQAEAQTPATFQTTATEAILIDVDTGAVLFEKYADKLFAPASMSKIMTLEILFKKHETVAERQRQCTHGVLAAVSSDPR